MATTYLVKRICKSRHQVKFTACGIFTKTAKNPQKRELFPNTAHAAILLSSREPSPIQPVEAKRPYSPVAANRAQEHYQTPLIMPGEALFMAQRDGRFVLRLLTMSPMRVLIPMQQDLEANKNNTIAFHRIATGVY